MGRRRVIVAKFLAVGDMYRGPTTVEVTLGFRGNNDKTPAKSAHNQCSDLCITPSLQNPGPFLRVRKNTKNQLQRRNSELRW